MRTLLIATLTTVLLVVAACSGDSEPEEASPTAPGVTISAPAMAPAGSPNTVGDFEITVLKVTPKDASEVSAPLPQGQTQWLQVHLQLKNSTSADLAAPAFTLSCDNMVVGGPTPEESPEALGAAPVPAMASRIGTLLFAAPGRCDPGVLLVRLAATSGRPPIPVPIRLN